MKKKRFNILTIIVLILVLYVINDVAAPYQIKTTPDKGGFISIGSGLNIYYKVNFLGIKTITIPFESKAKEYVYSTLGSGTDLCLREVAESNIKVDCISNEEYNKYAPNIQKLLEEKAKEKILAEYDEIELKFAEEDAYEVNISHWNLIVSKKKLFVHIFEESGLTIIYKYNPKKDELKQVTSTKSNFINFEARY